MNATTHRREKAMKELPREKTENGIHYTLHGDYYLPDISIPDGDKPIGKWGRMRLKFLLENKPILYNQMILNGTLQSHLVEIDQTATRRLERMISAMAAVERIDENLKNADQMEWVRKMNSIQQRAEEIILSELIYS